MKPIALALLLAALCAGPAAAQSRPPADTAATELVDGEVRRIDRPGGRLTLRHAEIRSLDMPGMTMVFQVKDPALLDRVKVGDKVRFSVVSEAGKLTVTDIRPAP